MQLTGDPLKDMQILQQMRMDVGRGNGEVTEYETMLDDVLKQYGSSKKFTMAFERADAAQRGGGGAPGPQFVQNMSVGAPPPGAAPAAPAAPAGPAMPPMGGTGQTPATGYMPSGPAMPPMPPARNVATPPMPPQASPGMPPVHQNASPMPPPTAFRGPQLGIDDLRAARGPGRSSEPLERQGLFDMIGDALSGMNKDWYAKPDNVAKLADWEKRAAILNGWLKG